MTALQFYTQEIRPEIEILQPLIVDRLRANSDIYSWYTGWKVWYSPVLDNPHVLFIGINPGPGENGSADLEPDGQLQYIYDQSPHWALKNDTLEVFDDAKIAAKVDLEDCVKTNYYYLGTKNFDSKFYELTMFLGNQGDRKGLGDIFLEKSKNWTRKLVYAMKPKLIICEGAAVFELLLKYALEENPNRTMGDVFLHQSKNLGIDIIGYKRQYGRAGIQNKELLVQVLNNCL